MLRTSDFAGQQLNQQWIFVKYSTTNLPTELTKKAHVLTRSKDAAKPGILKLPVPRGKDPIAYCNELRRSEPNLIYADPIVEYVPLSTPSDALLSNQYYLDNIKAYEAWDITKGDDDITVGIIDTGLDLDHEDIVANLWLNTDDPIDGIDNDENGFVDDYYGYDFADDDSDPSVQNSTHGMIVGGIAGASTNNGIGIAGVGYNTKVAALKGFRSSNNTSGGLYDAIIYAAENGFEVANLSWGRKGLPLQSEQDIINYVVQEFDIVLVAAAGNDGGTSTEEAKWYPASYDNVLSVGASDASDNKSAGSSFNHSVDLVAPGVSMFSTVNGNGYSDGGPGTSYAAPQVSATAALTRDQFPNLSAVQIMERIRVTTDDIYDIGSNSVYDGKLGKGRLNVLRAVSEAGIKSLRVKSPSLISPHGDQVFFGDTVKVTATLTNFLSPVNSPFITLSSPEENFSISTGGFSPGFMSTLDTRQISFEVILDEDILPETEIGIRFDFSASGYNDFQYLEVKTSPDYADFENNKVGMTISGDGDLGFNEYGPNFEGSGFQYLHDTLMTYTGLMLATGPTEVSDNIITNYTNQARNKDFSVLDYYKLYHHPGADHFGYSTFSDDNRPLFVEQSNIAWENEDFLIIRYRIVNNSSSPLSNLAVGIFADWELGDKTTNYAEYDLTGNYMFTRNNASDLFAGVQVLGGDSYNYSALDMADLNGNSQDVNDLLSDDSKYDFLINQSIASAGSMGSGNDVASINGVTINQIDPYADAFVNVTYAIADSQVNLENELASAQERLDEFLQKPRVLETLLTCDGTSVLINPTSGTNYEFYEDPLGQELIESGVSLNAGTISNDTIFYVRNIDNDYRSDIYAIRIDLFNDIADFEMSTDTLYLDHPTTNVVQFTDKSLGATSWSWDFGEGTTASLQSPSLSFSSTGTYNVTLEVENAFGCVDLITKDLVVANRPDSPSFDELSICPGEPFSLQDTNAEKLKAYTFQNSENSFQSGSSITFEDMHQDTTIYVSGVYGSFESAKVPVNIDVKEVGGLMTFLPDTTTENHQILLLAEQLNSGSEVEWFVEGQPSGSSESITIAAIEGSYEVELVITNENSCAKSIIKAIDVSTSPFAFHADLTSCKGESVIIRPENGTYFGFYEDASLTTLIKKGRQLETSEFEKVYVVGLDDGLPGMPIEVNVETVSFEASIIHTETLVGQTHRVNLSLESSEEIASQKWYIDGELFETIASPTVFLNNKAYEIVAESQSLSGCTARDTITLDYTPLDVSERISLRVYPNPNAGFIQIQTVETVGEFVLLSLDGKELLRIESPDGEIRLPSLAKGLYLAKFRIGNKIHEQEILLQ